MADPPAKLTSRDTGEETFLFNVQDHGNTNKARPEVDSLYEFDTDETFIVSLDEEGRLSLSGTASALRLSNRSRYSDDPLTALAQYAERLLSHVNGQQGTGWTYSNSYTGYSTPCIIEEMEVIRERGAKYQFDYAIQLIQGNGLFPAEGLDPRPVSPSTTATLDGQDLFEMEQLMITRSTEAELVTYALHEPEENDIEPKAGATQSFQIQGNVPGGESVRTTFDDNIRASIGKNTEAVYSGAFPGYETDVLIFNFNSTREAGVTQLGSYQLEMMEGRVGSRNE